MKKTIVLAGVVLTAFAFNGCNNEAALKEAQDKYNSQLTAATDSIKGAAKAEMDALKASYDAQVQALNDSLAAKTAALEAALAKKTGSTSKPATTTPSKPKVTSR